MFKLNQTLLEDAKIVWIAYSGGVDSHVLLHLFAASYANRSSLRAIHIHHGLSPYAKQWEDHCLRVCHELNIPCEVRYVDAKPKRGESPEAAARAARYAAFSALLAPNDYLVTAQHQQDQAETVLIQLLRGAGPKGLAAMPMRSPFSKGYLLRPLLDCSHADILQYAAQHHLKWIEDESNANKKFDRNFIRHEIFPAIEKRWPAAAPVLARVAKQCSEADILLTALAKQDLETLHGKYPHTLSIAALLQLDAARQRNVIRYWLRTLDFPVPSDAQMQRLQKDVLHSTSDASPLLCWDQSEIRRYRDELYVLSPLPSFNLSVVIPWDLSCPLELPYGLGRLVIKPLEERGIRPLTSKELSEMTVRFRQGGESCRPTGRQGTHSLKKLFQEWGVPPWERQFVPLLYLREDLVCVVGHCLCETFEVLSTVHHNSP